MLNNRWAVKADIPSMLQCNSDVTREDIELVLKTKNNVANVVEDRDGNILGFFLYELYKHSLTILDIGVNPLCHAGPVYFSIIQKMQDKIIPKHMGARWRVDYYIQDTDSSYETAAKLKDYGWRQAGNRMFYVCLEKVLDDNEPIIYGK